MLNRKGPESLADWIHAWTYDERPVYGPVTNVLGDLSKKYRQAAKLDLRMALRRSQRFVLDDEFVRYAAARSTVGPTEMLKLSDLARLPFNSAFIEYDEKVRGDTIRDTTTVPLHESRYGRAVGRSGLLIERAEKRSTAWTATTISNDPGSLPVWPVAVAFDSANAEADETNLVQIYLLEQLRKCRNVGDRDAFVATSLSAWGYIEPQAGQHKMNYAMHKELLLRGLAMPEARFFQPSMALLNREGQYTDRIDEIVKTMAYEAAGKLRWVTALLASLNTVPLTRVIREAHGSYPHRLHKVPNLSDVHVRIDATPGHERVVYDKALHQATGRHNRRHEVRGHWRDVSREKALSTCSHEPADVDGDYALCGNCTRLLKWIEHHERGDEKLGWVFHGEYDVK